MRLKHSRHRPPRRGMTLLEAVLSVSILAVLATALAAAMQCQVRLLHLQEGTAGSGVAESTIHWIGSRIRAADQALILNSSHLQITTETTTGSTVEQIYLQGDRLILETAGVAEEVAGPISGVTFLDPDGRGVSVSVTVQVPPSAAGRGPASATRVFPLDWMRS